MAEYTPSVRYALCDVRKAQMYWHGFLKFTAVFFLMLVLLLTLGCRVANDSEFDSHSRVLSVTGHGQVSVAPDVAVVDFGVSVLEKSVLEAQSTATSLMRAVMGSLSVNGIDDDDIVTTDFSITPEFGFSRDGERDFLGFRVVNRVSVKVRQIDNVGRIIDDGVNQAGDNVIINGIYFTVDAPEKLFDRARELAVIDGQQIATRLAHSSGIELGELLEIQETRNNGSQPGRFMERTFSGETTNTDVPPISSGQITRSVLVDLHYSIR